MEMLTRVFANDILGEHCAWFCLETIVQGVGEKKKALRAKALQDIVPDDVKIVNYSSLCSSRGQTLTLQELGTKRIPEKVCVGTPFGVLLTAVKNEKALKEVVSANGSLHYIYQAVNCLNLGQPEARGVLETPVRGKKRALFTTSTPVESTPLKRKRNSDLEDSGLCHSPSVTFKDISNSDLDSPVKRQRIGEKASAVYAEIEHVCKHYKETLADVLSSVYLINAFEDRNSTCKDTLRDLLESISDAKGAEETVGLMPHDIVSSKMRLLRSPDWVMLLFKLNAKLSDEGWQMLINLSSLARTGVRF